MKFSLDGPPGTECRCLKPDLSGVKSGLESLQPGTIVAGAAEVENPHAFLLQHGRHLRDQKGRRAQLHAIGQSSGRLVVSALTGLEYQDGRQHSISIDGLENLA